MARNDFHARYAALAEERGGKLLSAVYVNAVTKLRWRCHEGHEWEASPNAIQKGRWCPTCNGGVRNDGKPKVYRSKPGPKATAVMDVPVQLLAHLNAARLLARSFGGWLVSDQYHGTGVPMTWECEAGHRWVASVGEVEAGRWCPCCGGK